MRWLTAGCLCLTLLLVGCGDDDGGGGSADSTTSAEDASTTTGGGGPASTGAPATGYSESVETSFIDACKGGAGDDLADVCRCIYDGFEEQVPFEEFQQFDQALQADPTADLPPEFVDLYTNCVLEASPDDAPTTTSG